MYKLTLLETQKAIKFIKDLFQTNFAYALNLHRISAPIVLEKNKGINDDLSGIESPVDFYSTKNGLSGEIPQSLAKWKRLALKRYQIPLHEGIYADMNAIRKDEKISPIHSIYVDQWDWELHISKHERNINILKMVVRKIYEIVKYCQDEVDKKYNWTSENKLPDKIFFIDSEELYKMYPNLSSKEREDEIAKKYGAVFIIGIGHNLSCNKPHDLRASDYDDWNLNGDLIVWNYQTNSSLELSSMGIRVDSKSLISQLEISDQLHKRNLYYHTLIIQEKLPYSIGGGIGQSRLCYFLLRKQHIGEVQCSIWPDEVIREANAKGIYLL